MNGPNFLPLFGYKHNLSVLFSVSEQRSSSYTENLIKHLWNTDQNKVLGLFIDYKSS
jgi:hypothetical protein